MGKLIEIVAISGDWTGGHHGEYPKIFSLSPESDHPFCISEGHGWGGGGTCVDLNGLFERNFVKIFDRPESNCLYQKLVKAFEENKDQDSLVKELIDEFAIDT